MDLSQFLVVGRSRSLMLKKIKTVHIALTIWVGLKITFNDNTLKLKK